WLLSLIHIERITAMSSTQLPTCGHQSLTSVPHSPRFLKPTCNEKTFVARCSGVTASGLTPSSAYFFFRPSVYGVSLIDIPAYRLSAHFGSKLSTWLTPPIMKSQMTLLTFGAKCGRPSGGAQPDRS